MPQQPQTGDVVVYVDQLRRECAGIITALDGPIRARLAWFPPNGTMAYVWAIRYDPDVHGDDYWRSHPVEGYWRPRS